MAVRTRMLKVKEYICDRCAHVWIPRKEPVRQCPKCKTVRFDEARKEVL